MHRLIFIICIDTVLGKATQGYPVQQYIHVTGVPSYRSDAPHRQPNQPALVPVSIPKPMPEPIPIPIPNPILSPTSTSKNPSKKDAPMLDSNVLNNLAIALQLLIVSNILNVPPQEANSEIASKMAFALDPTLEAQYPPPAFVIESPKYEMAPKYSLEPIRSTYMEPVSVPNINYSPSQSYGETNVYGPFTPTAKPSPRAEIGFMSPYEAIGPNSPYTDPILSSSYRTVPPKRDFQSPYAAILSDNKDAFPMFEFF